MTLGLLITAVAALWLLSCGASLLALRWTVIAHPPRLVAAAISSGLALALAVAGMTRFHLTAYKSINGVLHWSFNSHWFFLGALLIAAGSLATVLWHWRQTRRAMPQPLTAPPPSIPDSLSH